jgi:hypothetical protein
MRDWRLFERLASLSFLLALLLAPTGCSTVGNAAKSAYRSAYYATVETFGVHKRDILKKKVVQARDDQSEAEEEFKDALTKLKEIYAFDGGNLEKQYKELNGKYESAAESATDVKERILSIETVAGDLFKEWEAELDEIKTVSLKVKSKKTLIQTRERYGSMLAALKKAEASMPPVLTKFKDHVLFLKHNLNAAAIASLKGEALNIQGDIAALIKEMNSSIKTANDFIDSL